MKALHFITMTTPDVQAELDLRTDIKPNGVAIVERGSTRHYYKKLAHGWKHISTSTDASPSFDHEQTQEQRAEALKQTQRVEEAMKKWFAAQAQPRTRTIGDVDGRCPANPKGIHSFNDTIHDKAGEKWGRCKCGASVHIPNSRDPLYCPATTDHRHDYTMLGPGGLPCCTCGATRPAQATPQHSGIVNFCYDNEPRVVIEYEVSVEMHMGGIGHRQRPIGVARQCYLKLRIPYDVAAKDNWFTVGEFVLRRHNTLAQSDEMFHAHVTELKDDGVQLEVEAQVLQGPF